MGKQRGRWYGKSRYFGLHYDLHAGPGDTDLGVHAAARELVPLLKRLGCDWVQTDCKGHPGYTSWFSETPGASVSPGLQRDAMAGWCEASHQLGLPLHCHYSGIWDGAAAAKHPDWVIVPPPGPATGAYASAGANEAMCPRRGYLEELMIPQMIELIDRYGVDGFWVDGDYWGARPCYCDRCKRAFTEQTGIAEPPVELAHPNWATWMHFTRRTFEAYVTRYTEAVHAHKPEVMVCSNWLQTLKHPGAPDVPTDWISGDVPWVFSLDPCRIEARFASTRKKHWDLMSWTFYASHGMTEPSSPWTFKPVQMLQQEVAITVALGGAVQLYENSLVRDGRLVPWRIDRLAEVGKFVKRRRSLCQDSITIPQIAVLHSEHHLYSKEGDNLLHGTDAAGVGGAVTSLLENHFGVDVLDEWALLPRLAEFPIVAAPEQDRMSDAAVDALKLYVKRGGRLLLTGAGAFDRFGADFLGVRSVEVEPDATYHLPAAGGAVPVFSENWRLLDPVGAKPLGQLGRSQLLDDKLTVYPAAVVHRVGKGKVAYAPFDLFHFFDRNRYPLASAFIGKLTHRIAGRLDFEVVKAPHCVDVVYRRLGDKTIIHLINRSSGIANRPNDGAVDEIPSVGPVRLSVRLTKRPRKVSAAFERSKLELEYTRGRLEITAPTVRIHAAVVIDNAR